MNIGEKIRRLRLSKLMTQAELAGDCITRNMLCCIERGAALPSLPTAVYLAGRLGVPVGFLLAEESEEFTYRKMMEFPNVKRAFLAEDYAGALALLNASFPGHEDDEIALLRAEAEYGNAKRIFGEGHFRRAAAAFDRALEAAKKTMYDTASMRACIAVYFQYLGGISPTLSSEVLSESEVEGARALGDDFCEYCMALDALEHGRSGEVGAYLSRNERSLYAARIAALELMKKEDYRAAQGALETLLDHPALTVGGLLYEAFGDMELCCRKNDDYKRAYEFSASRMNLLERLLEEA